MKIAKSLLVATLLFGIGAASTAYAADVTRYQSKGLGANAGWSNSDGCVSTSVNVYVADATTQVGGPPTETTSLIVAVWQYDFCTATALRNILSSVTLGPNQFVGSKKLDGASVLATVSATDYAASPPASVPLSINLAWTGEGDTYRGMYRGESWNGPYFYEQHRTGTYRPATVSGSISDGVTDYASSLSRGQLWYSTESSLFVYR